MLITLYCKYIFDAFFLIPLIIQKIMMIFFRLNMIVEGKCEELYSNNTKIGWHGLFARIK